jgi:hypothetical protein
VGTLEQYVSAILRGDSDAAGTPQCLLTLDALDSLARRTLARARRPEMADPRHLAVAFGYELLPRSPPGQWCGEGVSRGVIAYEWFPDPREVGVRVGHGTAHGVLEKSGDKHTDGDAWVLTAMILVPRAVVHTRSQAEVMAAAWAPPWFVRLAIPLGMSWREAV